MKKAQYPFFKKSRITIAVLLLLFISLKVTVFAFTVVIDTKKEIVASVDEEPTDQSKVKVNLEKEFISAYYNNTKHLFSILIMHYTAYRINYKSFYHNTITTPPPDTQLQFFI